MSTLTKDDVYFPHFARARNDRKIKRLRKDFKLEGYAVYFMILEILREQPGYKYPFDDIDLLADEIDISLPILNTILSSYGLFKIENDNEKMFFSPKQIEYMQPYLIKKEQRRLAGLASAQKRKEKQEEMIKQLSQADSSQRPFNDRSTKEKKEKETKEKESKSLSSKEEREIYKNVSSFRKHYVDMFPGLEFTTQSIGWENSTIFKIGEGGLLINTKNKKILTKEDALKVWTFAYEHFKNKAIKKQSGG